MADRVSEIDDLVTNHANELFAYACSRVQKQDVAEDLVQETFLAAMKSLERFENRSSALTWLIGILRNKIFDHYRANKKAGAQLRTCVKIS
ncbi:MAG: RNA polymerase sigma factor [Planctomycetes bacterium]|nr:RNA polymerase sigma factor [Planctomycetota bacterium]